MTVKYAPIDRLEKLQKRAQIARNLNSASVEIGIDDFEWVLGFAKVRFLPAILNEDLPHYCGDCGARLDIVRPGKWQCPNCE